MSMELLPETLIHRVQSFLTGKEAARSTLLSKSWRSAWSNRPTIDLDESHFPERCSFRRDEKSEIEIDGLADLANKTFRRYEESNLSIDTFSLCLKTESYVRYGLAKQWTLKALKLGATDLTFRFRDRNNDRRHRYYFDIPLTEVLRSENVQRLCLQCLRIDQLKVIDYSQLKSLTLIDFVFQADQFCDVISRFPLLEYLSLSEMHSRDDDGQQVIVRSPSRIILPKLRSLVLSLFDSQFQMKTLFLDDLTEKFPNLKDLTLGFIYPNDRSYQPDDQEIRNISSGTVETLNLRYVEKDRYQNYIGKKVAGFMIDVPSIRKFTFEGSCMPNLCFSPTPQWDSHVLISNHGRDLSNKWFSELSEFLMNLKGSKIHLCLRPNFYNDFDYEVGRMDVLNVLEVDDLTLDTKDVPSLSCYAFLDALFRSCHPKMITPCVRPPVNDGEVYHRKIYRDGMIRRDGGGNTRNNDLFICRTLELAMQVRNVLLPTQYMYGLRDLEELEAQQLFGEVWKTQPLSSILEDSTSERRRFRFRLKWKPSLNQCMRRSDADDDDNG